MGDNKIYQKKANFSLVMQTVRRKDKISRIDISRELGLDRSTISNIANVLIEKGALREIDEEVLVTPKGGRKPVSLGIDPSFGIVLGIEIQVGIARASVLNLNGEILGNFSIWLKGLSDLFECICYVYSNVEDYIKSIKIPLIGIGIGIPGHINPLEGIILDSSPFYGATNFNREKLENYFKIPVFIDNDANCCAWGVLQEKKETDLKNFLYGIIELHGRDKSLPEEELGFGVVVNGEVYYGDRYAAGEITKGIGRIGDLSSPNGVKAYFESLFKKIDFLTCFLDPGFIFLGGEFINHKTDVIEAINSLKKSKEWNNHDCRIEFSSQGEYEVSYGAGSMFIERLFKIPGVENNLAQELNWDLILKLREEKINE